MTKYGHQETWLPALAELLRKDDYYEYMNKKASELAVETVQKEHERSLGGVKSTSVEVGKDTRWCSACGWTI